MLKYFVLVFYSCLLAVDAYTQPLYSLRVYRESDGILLNRIGNLTQHSSGMIWFTSGELVFSFDGRTFHTHRYTNVNDSIPIKHGSAFIEEGGELLFTDNEGMFYVTENLQIRYNGKYRGIVDFNSRRSPYQLTNYLHEHRATTAIYSYAYLNAKGIDGYVLDLKQLRYYRHQAKMQKVVFTYPDNARGLLFDGDTCLLVTTERVYAVYKEKVMSEHVPCYAGNVPIDLNSVTRCFFTNGRYYLCNKDGIYAVVYESGVLKGKKLIDSGDLPKDAFHTLLTIGNDESIFLGTRSSGLYHFQRTWVKSHLSNNPLNSSMNSLLHFRNKIFTNAFGVWNIDGTYEKWSSLFFTQYNNDYFKDKNGYIYIDSSRHLAIYDSTGRLKKRYPVRMDFSVYCSYKDGVLAITDTQSFWVRPDTIIRLGYRLPFNHLLMRNNYSVITYQDTLLIGSVFGLMVYPSEKDKPIQVPLFKGTSVRKVMPEPKGRGFFVFTYGKGIYWYYKGRYMKAPLDDKEHLLFAHYLLFDVKGRVWIPANDGLYGTTYETWLSAIEKNQEKLFYYKIDRWDGITTAEFNGGTEHAAIKIPGRSNYFMSSVNGLVSFVPDNMVAVFPDSKIVLRHLTTDFAPVKDITSPLPNFDVLKIYVSVPYYANPENLLLEYKFAEDGGDWKPVGPNGEIYYSRSGAGRKELVVRYRKGFGPMDYAEQHFLFWVSPAWYETWLAKAFFVVSFLGLLFMVFRVREQQQKKKRLALENTIRERTHELHIALDDLTKSEDNLRESDMMKEKVIRVLAHDIRSPLMSSIYLGTHVKNTLESKGDVVDNDSANMMGEVINALHSILDYSNDFLVWYNLNHGNMKPHLYACNLTEIIGAVLKLYTTVIKTRNNTIDLQIEPGAIIYSDAGLVQIIIRNLIDNANKYTDGGPISIHAVREQQYIVLTIKNQGRPINEEKYAEIQELFNAGERDAYPLTDHKFGLNLVSFLVRKLGVKTVFTSNELGYTTIQLFFLTYNIHNKATYDHN